MKFENEKSLIIINLCVEVIKWSCEVKGKAVYSNMKLHEVW